MVLRRCTAMLSDEDEAMDAMQDVFVKIVRSEAGLDDRGLSSLLYRAATNTCLNKLRTRRRKPTDPQGERLAQIAQAVDATAQSEARSVIARLFGAEPESTGTIAVLHLHDGLTLEQTASVVGMSVSGVRKRLRKLQANLRALEGTA